MYESKQMTVKEAHELGLSYILNIQECKSSYRGKGIYILDFGNGIKIGMAKNITNRIKYYKSPWCRPIINEAYFKCQNEQALERFIKRIFKNNIKTEGSSEFLTNISFIKVVEFIKNNKYFQYQK